MAIFEKAGLISPLYSSDGVAITRVGVVAAGYQNFIICIELFFAAIGLRLAFPADPYGGGSGVCGTGTGRTVSLQSISSNLKETMNPKDIMADAIHNFHPNYQQYTQHAGQNSATDERTDDMEYYRDIERQPTNSAPPIPPRPNATQHQSRHGAGNASSSGRGRGAEWDSQAGPEQTNTRTSSQHGRVGAGFTEKTTLLSSDEELQ